MPKEQNENGFTAERVAEALRREVLEGALRADDRIKDNDLVARFAISRNTAREALRLVSSEGLVVLRLHSGATVRRLELDDIVDIFRVRRTIECTAVLASSRAPESLFTAAELAVQRAEVHLDQEHWAEAGTASLQFHEAIVALHGSPRLSRLFAQQVAQLRTAFWVLPVQSEFQARYIVRDREIIDLLLGGRREKAALELTQYLDDSEANLLDAYRAAARAAGSS